MFRPNVLSPLSTTTDYVNGYIFTNNNLSMAQTDNGYYTLSSTGEPTYHFYLKDHQGNNRVVVTENDSIVQTNHYYPYGALFAESTNGDVQRFKYNGKELDRKFGLNWYDHGARHNDAAIGRWHCMDPMAEEHPQFSPYSFCMGDPVNFGDYDGMDTLYFRINKDKVTANYTSRTLCEGDNVGIIKDDGGNTLHQFSFAHQDDAKHFFVNQEDYLDYCENNNINPNGFHMLDKVCLMSNEDVSSFISPIPSMDGGPQAWIYAWKESRGENKTMDIMFQINKRFQGEENLYIPYEDGSHIFNADGLVAHDKFNFGNYLWGIAIHKLGISYPIGVLGAHIDNMIHHWGALDSNDDQYSIRLGYFLGHR